MPAASPPMSERCTEILAPETGCGVTCHCIDTRRVPMTLRHAAVRGSMPIPVFHVKHGASRSHDARVPGVEPSYSAVVSGRRFCRKQPSAPCVRALPRVSRVVDHLTVVTAPARSAMTAACAIVSTATDAAWCVSRETFPRPVDSRGPLHTNACGHDAFPRFRRVTRLLAESHAPLPRMRDCARRAINDEPQVSNVVKVAPAPGAPARVCLESHIAELRTAVHCSERTDLSAPPTACAPTNHQPNSAATRP